MKFVLLSGGKGKRLWPLSTDSVPKQFIPLFEDSNSMLKKTYNSVLSISDREDIYIATLKEYENEIKNEIPNFENFIFEPSCIGTFGAILNIAAYLKEIKKIPDNEIIAVAPIDHDVDSSFYNIINDAESLMNKNNSDICLIGIKPTFISKNYGYIINSNDIVLSFKEKPNIEEASELISKGALWNSGIIIFRLDKIIKVLKKYQKYSSYEEFLDNYISLPHTSFDIEVLEKEKNISILHSDHHWNDLGTWGVLSSKLSKEDKYNTNIINFEDKEIKNEGVCNSIIVNTKDGIKLMSKDTLNYNFCEWGYYEILNKFTNLIIKRLIILPNKDIELEENINKEWFVLSGSGQITIDGNNMNINSSDTLKIEKDKKYIVHSITKLEIIEIQQFDNK